MRNSLFVLLFFVANLNAQTLEMLTSGTKNSFRGLSVVSEKIIWVSGSNGAVARSVDSGSTWKWFLLKGFENTDFRDIEAFDSSTAIIMGISAPAYILKTADGGETWKITYENRAKEMFLDAMDFRDKSNGIVVGDPINNKFFIARTNDGGNTWIENNITPVSDSGEACFASSGTNVRMASKKQFYFVSGGLLSRLFIKNKSIPLPILQGKETTGANSVALKNKRNFIIVGGDFTTPDSAIKNCLITLNKGNSWVYPVIGPHGYRSCVEHIKKDKWITCGLNGIDYSVDDGKTWQWISREGFHVCRKTKNGKVVFLAGANGKIAKIRIF